MNYLDELNASQRLAVECIEGPIMVIAGAGSGKTRVLTYRIAYMIENGIDPYNILALTFTNKAAREMKERIGKIIHESEAKSVMMGTFHSVFAQILRFNAERLGYPSNFTIYDTQDSKSLIKDIVKELNLDDKPYKASNVLGRISSAKNELINWQEYQEDHAIKQEDELAKRPHLGKIYEIYAKRCLKAGAMDFDDLLFNMHILLRDFPDVLHYYQQKFRYILVDEYQDTNRAQYMIVKSLADVYQNICVVGDDAQSIYSFRGANIKNILNFKSDYPSCKIFKLEQNYRSTQNIVNAANSVIVKNIDQIKKNVWTENQHGQKINVVKTHSDNEEGKAIINKIFDIKHQKANSYQDFAILYRTNRQSRAFEESLRKLNIPYKIFGGISFYQRKEVKDLLAYFRLTTNPNDEEALKRVINYPKRGIGKTTIEHIIVAANSNNVSLWEVINNTQRYIPNLSGSINTKLYEFSSMIQSFNAQMNKLNAFELANEIAKNSGIAKELYQEKDKGPEEVERYQNIQELLTGINEFVKSKNNEVEQTLAEFMIDVALLTDADMNQGDDKNYVSLMTIHSSKGLEFPYVFIVGMEENLFPSQMSLHTRSEMEEERRLFYVAITRAMESCTLSFANTRFVYGSPSSTEPSRFINEIDPQYLNFEYMQVAGGGRSLNHGISGKGLNRSLSMSPPNLKKLDDVMSSSPKSKTPMNNSLKVGFLVMHDRFGKGKITELEGEGADQKATIFFPHHGSKKVLIKFANLQLIEE